MTGDALGRWGLFFLPHVFHAVACEGFKCVCARYGETFR